MDQNEIQVDPGAPQINQAVTSIGGNVQGLHGEGEDLQGHVGQRGDENDCFGQSLDVKGRFDQEGDENGPFGQKDENRRFGQKGEINFCFGAVGGVKGGYSLATVNNLRGGPGLEDPRIPAELTDIV